MANAIRGAGAARALGWVRGAFAVLAATHCVTASAQVDTAPQAANTKLPGSIYLALSGGPQSGLVAIDPNDRTCRTVAEPSGVARWMRVAPQGRDVVCWRIELDPRRHSFFVVALDEDQKPVPIFDGAAFPCWSSDGKRLLVSMNELAFSQGETRTWTMNADGSDRQAVPLPATEQVWDWSADGQWVVTSSSRRTDDAAEVPSLLLRPLYVMRMDGSQARRIASAGEEGPVEGTFKRIQNALPNIGPRFAPSGQQVVALHLSMTGVSRVAALRSREAKLWVIDRDGSNRRLLVDGSDEDGQPDAAVWSPDGGALAVTYWTMRNGKPIRMGLMVVDADGKNRREIPLPDPAHVDLRDWR